MENKGYKAMILAAGLGTRLRPWTLEHPKALVPVKDVPMMHRVAERLLAHGFDTLGVNVCHFADQLKDYVAGDDFQELLTKYSGSLKVSDETGNLLDTGGGILKMSSDLDPEGEGFLVHNVDILSNARLEELLKIHREVNRNGVTLLVSQRDSSRKLTFKDGELAGWLYPEKGEAKEISSHQHPIGDVNAVSKWSLLVAEGEVAFSGIYIIGKKAIEEMRSLYGEAPFSVMHYFLNEERTTPVIGICQDDLQVIDIGKPESLQLANENL